MDIIDDLADTGGKSHPSMAGARTMMRTSDRGINAIIHHEGVVLEPYRDSVGVWTIGVGHTAAAGDPDPVTSVPISIDDAMAIFRRDLAKYEAGVLKAITVPMSQHQFDAAVSFHFNTGGIDKAQWVRTFNRGAVAKAAAQFMGWSKPASIIPRRKAEMAMFRDGTYPPATAALWAVKDGKPVSPRTIDLTDPQKPREGLKARKPDTAPVPPSKPVAPAAAAVGVLAAIGYAIYEWWEGVWAWIAS